MTMYTTFLLVYLTRVLAVLGRALAMPLLALCLIQTCVLEPAQSLMLATPAVLQNLNNLFVLRVHQLTWVHVRPMAQQVTNFPQWARGDAAAWAPRDQCVPQILARLGPKDHGTGTRQPNLAKAPWPKVLEQELFVVLEKQVRPLVHQSRNWDRHLLASDVCVALTQTHLANQFLGYLQN